MILVQNLKYMLNLQELNRQTIRSVCHKISTECTIYSTLTMEITTLHKTVGCSIVTSWSWKHPLTINATATQYIIHWPLPTSTGLMCVHITGNMSTLWARVWILLTLVVRDVQISRWSLDNILFALISIYTIFLGVYCAKSPREYKIQRTIVY